MNENEILRVLHRLRSDSLYGHDFVFDVIVNLERIFSETLGRTFICDLERHVVYIEVHV